MSRLDAGLIQSQLTAATRAAVQQIELFASIASTNTYLLGQPPPPAMQCRVAIADHQTAGRGRHERRWVSQPGSSLCLSFGYTFKSAPPQLPCLTLAIGAGVVAALEGLAIRGVRLKWPNDLVAEDGKLGGILTEVQAHSNAGTTVVSGLGLNIDLPASAAHGIESDWARKPVGLKRLAEDLPATETIAAALIDGLHRVMQKFAADGFAGFAADWAAQDWLLGREVTVDLPDRQFRGIAAGVDADGALLVDTGREKVRVVSGTVAT